MQSFVVDRPVARSPHGHNIYLTIQIPTYYLYTVLFVLRSGGLSNHDPESFSIALSFCLTIYNVYRQVNGPTDLRTDWREKVVGWTLGLVCPSVRWTNRWMDVSFTYP